MRIAGTEITVRSVPLAGSLVMPIGSFSTLDHVIVTVHVDESVTGQGEATVIPEFFGETKTDLLAQLQAISIAVEGADPTAIEDIHERIDRVASDSRSARAAVDEACYDVAGRAAGSPVWTFLGPRARDSVECTWVIGLKSIEDTVQEALERQRSGFKTFKVKIGDSDEDDLAKVAALRHAVGADALIRLDANGAYSARRAVDVLGRMAAYGIEMVEQPCAASDLDGMARVREELGIKVLADESVFSAGDAINVIEAGAADYINVKVQKLGGLAPARRVAQLAEDAALGCVVGSCLECGPGVAASAHFAIACTSARWASDLSAGLQMTRAAGGTEFGGLGPTIHEPRRAGLGFAGCA